MKLFHSLQINFGSGFMTDDYVVIKPFNNSVVLVRHMNKEKIIIKKGIGFAKKPGETISGSTELEKVFVLENRENSKKFNQLVSEIDNSVIGLCEEIICMISSNIKEPLNERIHVALVDHIAFTLKRTKNNDMIANPFTLEIKTLYPREMEIAKMAVNMLKERTGLDIPDDEAGFLALHIHSARNRCGQSNSLQYALLCNEIIELIEKELNISVDRSSIDYSRFIYHIRLAFDRAVKKIPVKNALLNSIKRTYPVSYSVAKKAAKLIEDELKVKLSNEEKGYIAMHIERLKNASSYQ